MFGFSDIENQADEQLMQLVCKGKQKAFETLYERYCSRLTYFAQTRLGDYDVAADLVQDVFIKLIERPEMFDSTKRFSTWIYTVTGNACKNVVRNESNRARLLRENPPETETVTTPGNSVKDKQLLQKVINDYINTASEKEQIVYTLRFVEEMSIKEIAAVADIPEGSVKSCIYYLLKKFRQQLKGFGYE